MKWEGCSNWPPAWAASYGCGDIFPVGEEGVLTDIVMAQANGTLPRHLILTMAHLENTWSGLILLRRGRSYHSPARDSQRLHRLADKSSRRPRR
jgi:hypothetical protein